jgi:hypothetical protein
MAMNSQQDAARTVDDPWGSGVGAEGPELSCKVIGEGGKG